MTCPKKKRFRIPRTVDEAAEILISGLSANHQQALSQMSDEELDRFCESIASYILDDFGLWSGNEDLLQSCYESPSKTGQTRDPAGIILRRVREKLQDTAGIFIIT